MLIDVILYQWNCTKGPECLLFFLCGGFVVPKRSMRTPHGKLGLNALQPALCLAHLLPAPKWGVVNVTYCTHTKVSFNYWDSIGDRSLSLAQPLSDFFWQYINQIDIWVWTVLISVTKALFVHIFCANFFYICHKMISYDLGDYYDHPFSEIHLHWTNQDFFLNCHIYTSFLWVFCFLFKPHLQRPPSLLHSLWSKGAKLEDSKCAVGSNVLLRHLLGLGVPPRCLFFFFFAWVGENGVFCCWCCSSCCCFRYFNGYLYHKHNMDS